jgi:hypothetical protein
MARSALVSGFWLLLAACGSHSAPAGTGAAPPTTAAPPTPTTVPQEDAAPTGPASNPLGLPSTKVTLDTGKRVFTFSQQMLAAARPGATLVLSSATVAAIEGDDLLIEGKDRPSYKVHPGYVIPVPDEPKLRMREPVLTEFNGLMRHGVVLRFVKDKIAVRFTDLSGRTNEFLLLGGSGAPKQGTASKAVRFVRQVEGLAPGNYAALRSGEEWLHVLLVSASGEGEARRWFALGYGGAAMLVAERDLKPIPIKFRPKLGSVVWAEWSGTMRRATVQSADEPGLFTIKYERAGRPAVVGWGLLTAPFE